MFNVGIAGDCCQVKEDVFCIEDFQDRKFLLYKGTGILIWLLSSGEITNLKTEKIKKRREENP